MCRRRQRTLTAAISAPKTPEIPVGFFFFALFTGKRRRCFPPLRWDECRQQLDRLTQTESSHFTPKSLIYIRLNNGSPWSVLHAAPSVSLTDKKIPDIQGWGASFFHANLLLSTPTTRLWFAKAASAGAVSSSPRGSARAQRRICISA